MSLLDSILEASIHQENLHPVLGRSQNYKHWVSIEDLRRCLRCEDLQGQIWEQGEKPWPEPPVHPNCRCHIVPMETIQAGTATIDGYDGADWTIKYMGTLPEYYILKEDLKALGWREGKAPSDYAPGKMVAGGIYQNRNGHLPSERGRVWYEADLNYRQGRRNRDRILWSNDGLIFVTYDHYKTFYEIV